MYRETEGTSIYMILFKVFSLDLCELSNINIGKYFLQLIDGHLNKDNPLNKILNWNTRKTSYFCTINMFNIIHNHNNNLIDKSLRDNQQTNKLLSNYRNTKDCPKERLCNSEKSCLPNNYFPAEK